MSETARRSQDQGMTIQLTERDLRQSMELASEWRPHNPAETRLFDASRRLLGVARQLELASGAPGSAGATDVSMRALSEAFESLANASLMIRDAAAAEFHDAARSDDDHERLEQLGRALFAVDQNLRFAARAGRLSREALAGLPSPR
jgi:hypothetical protein